ncbi:MAG: Bro-N domain-containing protein [Clostridiales bacterium]|nr:Bro-N domain-containing protein [Clostridiales bacterium]
MSNLTVFNNQQFGEVRATEINGEPWFVLADVCRVLEIGNTRNVTRRLDIDEKGVHEMDTLGGKQNLTVINESGLYSVILRSDKPQAKPFRKWVTSEVLPTIRKTGEYKAKPSDELRRKNTEIREQNAKIRTAQLLYKIADKTDTDYKQVLHARITQLLTGEYLLPLPAVNERTYSATEIGERLGVSARRIGMLANAHGLKSAEFGKYFYDKAKTADKQVETFRYYEKSVDVFRSLISAEVAV